MLQYRLLAIEVVACGQQKHTFANVGLAVPARDVIEADRTQKSAVFVAVGVRRGLAGQGDVVRVRDARARCCVRVCVWCVSGMCGV